MIWECHVEAVSAFLSVQTQWRTVLATKGLVRTGLDYAAADAGLRLAGITSTPELWDDIRFIELGAIAAGMETVQ